MNEFVVCPKCKNMMKPSKDPNGESTGDWYCPEDGSVVLVGYGYEEE